MKEKGGKDTSLLDGRNNPSTIDPFYVVVINFQESIRQFTGIYAGKFKEKKYILINGNIFLWIESCNIKK